MKQKLSKYFEAYMLLPNQLRNHYNNLLLACAGLFLGSIVVLFAIDSKKIFIAFIILAFMYSIYILHQIYLFVTDQTYYMRAEIIDIDDQKLDLFTNLKNPLNWFMISTTIYGKCTMYAVCNGHTYELQIPRKSSFKPGLFVDIWFDGNAIQNDGQNFVIPYTYFVQISKQ